MLACRELQSDEAEARADLLIEMQAHYEVYCPPREDVVAGILERPAGLRLLLAWRDADLAGMAAFAGIYPGPGLRRGLYMNELYVAAAHRGRCVGSRLMSALAGIAVGEGYSRIDWTVDGSDALLQAFYERHMVVAVDSKRFYRLTGEALAWAAGRTGPAATKATR